MPLTFVVGTGRCGSTLLSRILNGLRTGEMIDPFGTGRFRPATGVPLISHFVLPMLTAEPDELFDALAAEPGTQALEVS